MNRKLQRTVMALTATASVFAVLLLAGGPAVLPGAAPAPAAVVLLPTGVVAAEVGEAIEAAEQAEPTQARTHRRHLRRARAVLALPYFSFAQGLRPNRS